jgi:periplasmic protein TonB
MPRHATLQPVELSGPPAPLAEAMVLPVIVPPDVQRAPRRAAKGRLQFALALLAAFGFHAAVLTAAIVLMRDTTRVGSGGIELDVITVGLVDASALEARPSTEPVPPATAIEPIRRTDGTQATEAAEATPPPVVAAAQDKLIDAVATPGPSELDVARKQAEREKPAPEPRDAIEVASIVPPQPAAADDGAAAIIAAPSQVPVAAAVRARAGVVTAYKKSVAEALSKNPPKRVGAPGQAVVSFRISSNGAPSAVEVTTSSGNNRIDDAVLSAVRGISFAPPPAALSEDERTFNVPYRFK